MATLRRVLLTAITALTLHTAILCAKVYAHPSHSILAVFRVGGQQAYHPPFIETEHYPLEAHGTGSDGQQYLYVAHDPLALGAEMPRAIDAPRYRYGRILLPAMAAAVCAGSSPCLPRAIIGLNLVFVAGIGAVVALLVGETGASLWWGVMLACSGPLACATDIANVEVAAQFFGLLGVLCFSRQRKATALVAWSLAALARESYVLVPMGYALVELLPLLRAPHRLVDWLQVGRRTSSIFLTLVPWIAWNLYVRSRLPPQASNGAASNLTWPFGGIVEHLVSFVREPRVTGSTVVTVAIALPLLAMMVRHTRALRRDRSGLALATELFVLMGMVAAPQVWVRAGGFARALDFIYPGAVMAALRRGDRTTAWLGASTVLQTINIVLDHLFVSVS